MSDYFAAMFTNDVREAKQEEIKMEGVDPDALKALVRYAYTGKSSITHIYYIDMYLLLSFPQFSECNPTLLDPKELNEIAKQTNSENCEILFMSTTPSRVK